MPQHGPGSAGRTSDGAGMRPEADNLHPAAATSAALGTRADSAFGVDSVTLSQRRQSRSVIALIEGTGPPAAAR